jgi:hypothetical protein
MNERSAAVKNQNAVIELRRARSGSAHPAGSHQ